MLSVFFLIFFLVIGIPCTSAHFYLDLYPTELKVITFLIPSTYLKLKINISYMLWQVWHVQDIRVHIIWLRDITGVWQISLLYYGIGYMTTSFKSKDYSTLHYRWLIVLIVHITNGMTWFGLASFSTNDKQFWRITMKSKGTKWPD